MKNLIREEFDQIMHSGSDMILLFYQKENAACTIALQTFTEVDAMHAKPFDTYKIDIESEPEIALAFDIKKTPEYISMKNSKIYKRSHDLLYTNQILDLLK